MKRVCILLLLCAAMLVSVQSLWSAESVRIAKVTPADSASSATKASPASPLEKKINVEMKDTTLDEALKVLLGPADISYRIDPDVANLKVTAVLKNVSLSDALQEIVKASGTAMERQNNVLHIMARHPAPNTLTVELERKLADLIARLGVERHGKAEGHPAVESLQSAIADIEKRIAQERALAALRSDCVDAPKTGQKLTTQVFTIEYINPAELVPLIYTLGARQVTVVSGGKLVVNASDDVLPQVADIISQLDTENALPRPVRVKVLVSYVLSNKNGPVQSADASMEGAVAEGQPIRLKTNAEIQLNEIAKQTLLQEVELTPTIGPDDRITLMGAFRLSHEPMGGRQADGSEIHVAMSTVSGKQTVIGSGALTVPGAIGYKLEYEVTAIATIGEGRLRTRTGIGGGGLGGGFNVPGIGNFGGFGGYGGSGGLGGGGFGAAMDEAATQWKDAFGEGGSFSDAMNKAATEFKTAFGEQTLDICPPDAGLKVPGDQDSDENGSSGGGGGGN